MFVAGAEISDDELKMFSELLEKTCGLSLGREKAYLFDSRLSQLMFELECKSFSELYKAIKDPASPDILDRVIDLITTQETMWFRDAAHWRELEETVIPELAQRARKADRRFWIWSCACSTGQEPYSLSMLATESSLLRTGAIGLGNDVCIIASDVSGAAISIARKAKYGRLAMHRGNLGATRKQKYFTQEGNTWTLQQDISRLVQLRRFNLKDDMDTLGMFDLILCRNVLVYFSRDFRRTVLNNLAKVLRPGGYLFLGASEGLYGDSDAFELVEGKGCIYYRCAKERR